MGLKLEQKIQKFKDQNVENFRNLQPKFNKMVRKSVMKAHKMGDCSVFPLENSFYLREQFLSFWHPQFRSSSSQFASEDGKVELRLALLVIQSATQAM